MKWEKITIKCFMTMGVLLLPLGEEGVRGKKEEVVVVNLEARN